MRKFILTILAGPVFIFILHSCGPSAAEKFRLEQEKEQKLEKPTTLKVVYQNGDQESITIENSCFLSDEGCLIERGSGLSPEKTLRCGVRYFEPSTSI